MTLSIYVASSWRNPIQPKLVTDLRCEGFEVYDFKDAEGFSWKDIDPEWLAWDAGEFRYALSNPLANKGFKSDMDALGSCDVCILALPCGKSAHLELGWAVAAKKKTIVYYPPEIPQQEPELMYKMCDRMCLSWEELLKELKRWSK